MFTKTLNVFIVNQNPLTLSGLRNYLYKRFTDNLDIFTFQNGETALQYLNKNTNIVILDNNIQRENGKSMITSIKSINRKTEVIMLSSDEDMAVVIESFRTGATNYVVKGEKAWKNISTPVLNAVMFPVRVLVKEFGVNKYLAMFLLSFSAIGIAVFISVTLFP